MDQPIIPGTDTALMLAHGPYAGGRRPARSRLPRPLLPSAGRCSSAISGRDRRPAQGRGLGRRASPASRPTTIAALARRAAGRRALVTVAHSLQRAEHGEQPVWMGAVLAAALGQIGLPGGGYAYALGAIALLRPPLQRGADADACRRARNGVAEFIPVARIADMLLNPGGTYRYNGQTRTYPDIRLVYWAGGNPVPPPSGPQPPAARRLRESIRWWCTSWPGPRRRGTPISFCPATMTLEREDIGGNANDPLLVADAADRRALRRGAGRLRDLRRSGRTARRARGLHRRAQRPRNGWSISMSRRAKALAESGLPAPELRRILGSAASLVLPQQPDDGGLLRAFRDDPDGAPLPTPSGKIEIFSATIAGFGEADCPGHPAWLPPADVPSAAAPLLPRRQPAGDAAAQPARFRRPQRGARSIAAARWRACIPADAAARGIADGDIIRLFNARGACLAARARHRRHPRPAWCSCRPAPGTTRGSRGGSPALRARQSRTC